MPIPSLLRIGAAPGRRLVVAAVGAAAAWIIAAPYAFAETDSVRFDFDPADPNAQHEWSVPTGVTEVEVEVAGAGGGGHAATGGNGALVKAAISVAEGTKFDIGVGGGGESTLAQQSGGGGASIVESGDILVIAGGGGGGTTWVNSNGGDAGFNQTTGAGEPGGITTKRSGGVPGALGVGGTGPLDAGDGEDYDPSRGLDGTGGQRGRGAQVGGPGGEARDEYLGNYGDRASPALGGGGGAGYGGGSSGFDAYSWQESNLRGGGGGGGSIAQGTGVALAEGESFFYSSNGGQGGQTRQEDGEHGWVIIRWTVPDPPPAPQPQATETPGVELPRPMAVPVTLSLQMSAGLRCSMPDGSAEAAWVQLPSASDCSPSSFESRDAGTRLLGWATTPAFPSALALAHTEGSKTAMELRDDTGHITAVFIPAGGWVHMTGNTTLYPIWG